MAVQRRTYRFRILNASIARSYNWRLSHSSLQFQVVGTDGGTVPRGIGTTGFRHAPAERYEVVLDFSRVPQSVRTVELRNLSNDNNVDYDHTGRVLRFDLTDEPVDTSDPTWNRTYAGVDLAPNQPLWTIPVDGPYRRRDFRFERHTGMWMINDMSWADVERSGFRRVLANPGANDVEIWRIENRSGGWFHPVHIHLVDFRILRRSGGAGRVLDVEQGPKDVVYIGENEIVDLMMRFVPALGSTGGHYMVHCHNAPHEDHHMMNQFSVGEPDIDASPHHPVRARPAVPDPTYPG